MLHTTLLLALSLIPAQAAELDDLLTSDASFELRPSELREAFSRKAHRGFELTNYRLRTFTGGHSDDPMSNVDARCAVQQFQELKKVNWKKYTSRTIDVDFVTKLSLFGAEVKPHFTHDKDTTDEKSVGIDAIQLVHRSFTGCKVFLAAEIEAAVDERIRAEKDGARARRIAERTDAIDPDEAAAVEKAKAKEKLLELIGKSAAPGPGPLSALTRPGECGAGEVLCARDYSPKRAPAYERTPEAAAALGESRDAR